MFSDYAGDYASWDDPGAHKHLKRAVCFTKWISKASGEFRCPKGWKCKLHLHDFHTFEILVYKFLIELDFFLFRLDLIRQLLILINGFSGKFESIMGAWETRVAEGEGRKSEKI